MQIIPLRWTISYSETKYTYLRKTNREVRVEEHVPIEKITVPTNLKLLTDRSCVL